MVRKMKEMHTFWIRRKDSNITLIKKFLEIVNQTNYFIFLSMNVESFQKLFKEVENRIVL